ncbi:MAG: hypothetical protein PSV17_07830 [Methylotenera sp.]|uniref:hypothetical protein n=1 Tax=Methylotenera sp. TaxID=2051956 RepID=UPI00248928D9|nr:hypothetical protein [Methylotenera sp.]MDI1309328.1 hypothetical protein [Methylotenera sp.]
MNSLKNNRRIQPGFENYDSWPFPNIYALDAQKRANFETRKSAIDQYMNGVKNSEILKNTGINRQLISYLLKRCTQMDEKGEIVGYFGLIKGKQVGSRVVSTFNLNSGKPTAGSLQALFLKYPDLKITMKKLIIEGVLPQSKNKNSRLTWDHIHRIFLDECETQNIRSPSYPFCSESKGKSSLVTWGKRLLERKEADSANRYSANVDFNLTRAPSKCYQRVEADGHFLDVNWTLEVPGLNGEGSIYCKVSRLWLLALLEDKSGAVLGYSISLGKNYNASDLAEAVRSSLVPWEPRNLSITTISYKPDECLPNALIPELAYMCYEELWIDNAKSHLSALFMTMLERTVNAVPVFGPKASPNVRPKIELLFDLLEEAGIHCLDGTTGSNSKDLRRAKDAKYALKLETLLDLIDLLIVRYNTSIAPGTTISRNEVLRRAVMRETDIYRRIPIKNRDKCIQYSIFDEAVIGQDRGKPVVRWKNARYFGAGLSLHGNLIGQKVLVLANKDVRQIEVVLLSDGGTLGILYVEKRWLSTPHSLFARSTVRKFMTNNSFLKHAADIPLAFINHVKAEAANNATNQRILARLFKDQEANAPLIVGDKDIFTTSVMTYEIPPVEESENEINKNTNNIDSKEDELEEDELDKLIKGLGTTYR